MISKENMEKFKKLFKEEYGVEYTDQEAYEAASNLVGFFKLLHEIDIRDKREKNG